MQKTSVKSVNLNQIQETAEAYYRNGDFYCSEAILKTLIDAFKIPCSDDVIKLASGFPVGIGGSKCTCGAISGAVLAVGLLFGRNKAKDPAVNEAMELSAKVYEDFIEKRAISCCKILTSGMEMGSEVHLKQCIMLTGDVAKVAAKIIAERLCIEIIES